MSIWLYMTSAYYVLQFRQLLQVYNQMWLMMLVVGIYLAALMSFTSGLCTPCKLLHRTTSNYGDTFYTFRDIKSCTYYNYYMMLHKCYQHLFCLYNITYQSCPYFSVNFARPGAQKSSLFWAKVVALLGPYCQYNTPNRVLLQLDGYSSKLITQSTEISLYPINVHVHAKKSITCTRTCNVKTENCCI